LKKDLPYGWSEILSKKAECSTALVSYILSGVRKDTKGVIPLAYELAAKELKRKEDEKRNAEVKKAEYLQVKQQNHET
jgi:hypothetical protein